MLRSTKLLYPTGQPPAQEIQGHLRSEAADARAITNELPLQDVHTFGISKPNIGQANGLRVAAAVWTGDPRSRERVRRVCPATRPNGHGFGRFFANGAVL